MMKKVILIIVLLITVYTMSGLVFTSNELQYEETIKIEVKDGDALWNIASSVNNGRYNTQKIINEIKDINDLDNSYILPGQKLEVPIIAE